MKQLGKVLFIDGDFAQSLAIYETPDINMQDLHLTEVSTNTLIFFYKLRESSFNMTRGGGGGDENIEGGLQKFLDI